jgi:hypothetical protein
LTGITEIWRDAGGDFSLPQTPTNSPPDIATGMGTPDSLYELPPLGVSLLCVLRVWLFAMGRVIT